jgi:NAD(P)-dependent dehydrogenase (short-subunit alcohol dehydrogenase family)
LWNEEAVMQVRGAAVMVTGASRGLGAALARCLAREGARVVLVARGRDELERVAAAIREEGGAAHALAGDVGGKEHIHRLAGAAAALVGPMDLLVHNASTLGRTPLPLLLDTDCEEMERVLAVNLVGPFRLSKALAGSMALRGGGLVVHVSSDAAVTPYPRWGAYGVSKAALDHLGRIWAAELEGTGVRFLTVDPGEMDTEMHALAMPEADRRSLARPESVAETILDMIQAAETVPSGTRLEAAAWSRRPTVRAS